MHLVLALFFPAVMAAAVVFVVASIRMAFTRIIAVVM